MTATTTMCNNMATTPAAAPASPLSTTLTKPSKRERFLLACQRANSYPTRPATIGCQQFYDYVKPDDEADEWKTLPERILRLERHLLDTVKLHKSDITIEAEKLTAAIFSAAPPNFLSTFRDFFTAALTLRHNQHSSSPSSPPTTIIPNEDRVYAALRTLHWLPHKLSLPLTQSIHHFIRHTLVRTLTRDDFESSSLLTRATRAKDRRVTPWLTQLISPECFEREKWEARLNYAVADSFVAVRVEDAFEMVADFPDSTPAVQELRVALEVTRGYGTLAQSLRGRLERRLIHPGANTAQIIEVYINTIKVLRMIDPTDGLLDAVAPPVRSYLRGRSDTVRCIITSLTDEKDGGDLYEELRRQDARPLEQTQVDSDDDEDAPDPHWNPSSKQQQQQQSPSSSVSSPSTTRGNWDILSMLVGIYGSKELFVNEYRVMLADKLLQNVDFDTDKEVHNLELLKLRFGETSMRQCEVMVKDMDDSKRINANIHSTLAAASAKNKTKNKLSKNIFSKKKESSNDPSITDTPAHYSAAIISHIFWPPLQKDPLTIHPRIQRQLDSFSTEYAKLKNPRRLIWLPQQGTVTLELMLEEVGEGEEGGTSTTLTPREFHCTPLHATLITHFEDRPMWTLKELAEVTGVPEDVVRKRMGYWISQRVVAVATNLARRGGVAETVYQLTRGAGGTDGDLTGDTVDGATTAPHPTDDDEDDSRMVVSLESQEEEDLRVYESYIVGMLANLGQCRLEKIHNMLKMFAGTSGSEHKYDKTPQQLRALLKTLCDKEKVECSADGMYCLVKK